MNKIKEIPGRGVRAFTLGLVVSALAAYLFGINKDIPGMLFYGALVGTIWGIVNGNIDDPSKRVTFFTITIVFFCIFLIVAGAATYNYPYQWAVNLLFGFGVTYFSTLVVSWNPEVKFPPEKKN